MKEIVIIYQLVEEDVQEVAEQVLERKLNSDELSIVKNKVEEKINWFEAIESAINETLVTEQKEDDF